jgi:hypothetical protein
MGKPWPCLPAILILLIAASTSGAAQERTEAWQIGAAVLPLPDSLRAGATVLGYRSGGLEKLRAGTNGMVCLADDPAEEGFHAACYHEGLEPFMARGRALRAKGLGRASVDSARLAEIESGTLAMAKPGAVLYSVSLKDAPADPAAGLPPGTKGLAVIYLPYATEASSGLSTQPSREHPWLMFAGKPWAHAMITR